MNEWMNASPRTRERRTEKASYWKFSNKKWQHRGQRISRKPYDENPRPMLKKQWNVGAMQNTVTSSRRWRNSRPHSTHAQKQTGSWKSRQCTHKALHYKSLILQNATLYFIEWWKFAVHMHSREIQIHRVTFGIKTTEKTVFEQLQWTTRHFTDKHTELGYAQVNAIELSEAREETQMFVKSTSRDRDRNVTSRIGLKPNLSSTT
jgi:hypothetical protein